MADQTATSKDSEKKPRRRFRRARWITIGVLLAHVAGFFTSVHAIMSVRTPQGTIAWAMALNTFPYVSIPAYWVFGRNGFQGYVTLRQGEDQKVETVTTSGRRNVRDYMVALEDEQGEMQALEALAKMPFTTGNRAELLIDGNATFDSIFAGIDAAEEYVLVQFYIVKDDDLGRRLKDKLIARAREGVRVYFLYDEIGSHELPASYGDELRAAGAEVSPFHSTKGSGNRFQLNFRNHRKIVVGDGNTAWVGGHNVGDEYLGLDPKFGHWRDTHVKIEGPAAIATQVSFVEDWHWATDSVLSLSWDVHEEFVSEEGMPVLMLASGPADQVETAGLFFTHAINSARRRVWIASPYFVPDESVAAALRLAAMRGVEVRILIPDNPDHYEVYLAAFSFLDKFKNTDIEIYRYTDGFLHEKVILVDDTVAAIGTANLDNRSFRLNFEIMALFLDAEFAAEVEQMFLDDFRRSRVMEKDEYEKRSFLFRLAVRASRLLAPIL